MKKSIGVYRVQDPIENFRIRVRVREIFRLQQQGGNKDALFNKTFNIQWQQKIYSPLEIVDYINNKNSISGDARVVANRKRLARLDSVEKPVAAALERVMLFSYTDSERYSAPPTQILVGSDDKESYTAAALMPGEEDMDSRQSKLKDRLSRERNFKEMHICAATDVSKSATPDDIKAITEHLICSIRLYSDGLLEVTPDFSQLIEESSFSKHELDNSADTVNGIFASDRTAAIAAKKGLIIATRRFRAQSGAEFEYTIENVNGILSPIEMEDFQKKEYQNDIARSLKLRGVQGPLSNWMQDPPKESFSRSVAVNAEILSATGFDGEKLFVVYEVICPPNWDLRTGNLNDGIASEDSGSEKSFSEIDQEEDVLLGQTQIAIATDSSSIAHNSGFGIGTNADITLLTGSENMLWGGLFFVITCLSVVVGYSYAFWIVPALVIIIVLGTGTPGAGKPEEVHLSEEDSFNLDWGAKYNRHEGNAPAFSVSADSRNRGTILSEPVAYFSHPVILSFDVRDEPYESAMAPSGAFPVLVFEVYSMQSFGVTSLEGYGYVPLPEEPGFKDVSVATWKPVGSRVSRLRELFCGGSPALKYPIFAEIPNKTAPSLSRFGVLTEGAGSVRFRINVGRTDPRLRTKAMAHARKAMEVNKIMNTRRSVDDILQQFKGTSALNKSLSRAPAGSTKEGGWSTSTASVINDARPEKVTDILSRVKARMSATNGGNRDSGNKIVQRNDQTSDANSEEAQPLIEEPPRQQRVQPSTPFETPKRFERPPRRDAPIEPDETAGLLTEAQYRQDEASSDLGAIGMTPGALGEKKASKILRNPRTKSPSVDAVESSSNGAAKFELKPLKAQPSLNRKISTPKDSSP